MYISSDSINTEQMAQMSFLPLQSVDQALNNHTGSGSCTGKKLTVTKHHCINTILT